MFYNGQVGESIPDWEMFQPCDGAPRRRGRVVLKARFAPWSALYICAQTIFVCR